MRTRFAPSPTGNLHVGGLRTALYAWLIAKQTRGEFLVRVEDTDKEREVPGSVEQMLQALQWAGLEPDEGVLLSPEGVVTQRGTYGPYMQSQRLPMYREAADKLIEQGNAYYAFDTKEEIDAMRLRQQEAGNPAPKYDARARKKMRNSLTLSKEEVDELLKNETPYVIRMKVPEKGSVEWDDMIREHVSFQCSDVDDQVLLKSDGYPTYHLAHVVDDHFMQIDIVMRGEEWLSSTPKHLLLFEWLGWPVPRYAHLPLMLNSDHSKLSKRQGDVSVDEYITKGYLPEALLNFVAFLGWNPGTVQEILTMEEMVEQFSLERVQKAGAVFDTQKLDWLQGQWMRKMDKDEFIARVRSLVVEKFPAASEDTGFARKAALIQDRITFMKDAPDMLGYFYEEPAVTTELLANSKQKVTMDLLPAILKDLTTMLEAISEMEWNDETLLAAAKAEMAKGTFKLGQLLWPLRAALTGREFSPGATEVAAVLGKTETLKRIAAAQALVKG